MEQINKDYDAFFWIALVFSCMAGWIWARGNLWLGAASFLFCLILLATKWIFIELADNQSKEKGVKNENENE